MAYGAITVGTSAVAVPATGTVRTVYNNGSVPVFRGDNSSVTTSTGTPIQPGGNWRTLGAVVYLIAGTAGQDVRWITE